MKKYYFDISFTPESKQFFTDSAIVTDVNISIDESHPIFHHFTVEGEERNIRQFFKLVDWDIDKLEKYLVT